MHEEFQVGEEINLGLTTVTVIGKLPTGFTPTGEKTYDYTIRDPKGAEFLCYDTDLIELAAKNKFIKLKSSSRAEDRTADYKPDPGEPVLETQEAISVGKVGASVNKPGVSTPRSRPRAVMAAKKLSPKAAVPKPSTWSSSVFKKVSDLKDDALKLSRSALKAAGPVGKQAAATTEQIGDVAIKAGNVAVEAGQQVAGQVVDYGKDQALGLALNTVMDSKVPLAAFWVAAAIATGRSAAYFATLPDGGLMGGPDVTLPSGATGQMLSRGNGNSKVVATKVDGKLVAVPMPKLTAILESLERNEKQKVAKKKAVKAPKQNDSLVQRVMRTFTR